MALVADFLSVNAETAAVRLIFKVWILSKPERRADVNPESAIALTKEECLSNLSENLVPSKSALTAKNLRSIKVFVENLSCQPRVS